MSTALPTKRMAHWFALIEAIARRLEREELVERHAYEVEPDCGFDPCGYCDERQGPAVLDWSWARHDSHSDGGAQTCAKWACIRAALSEAEQDAEPENIVVEYPVLVAPVYAEAMAA